VILLDITKGKLQLARVQLTNPLTTIGRSPFCNVVLRAPGVGPLHFLLEWVGVGEFNPETPEKGSWSIFRISERGDASGEGLVLGKDGVSLDGFQFKWIESALESQDKIGGAIQASLSEPLPHEGVGAALSGKDLVIDRRKAAPSSQHSLEIVQIRSDSGAVEEVVHENLRLRKKVVKPLREFPEFKILSPGNNQDGVSLLLEEMPGAEVYLKGVRIDSERTQEIRDNELLLVNWKGRNFYVRIVSQIRMPWVRQRRFSDPVLVGLFFLGTAIVLLATILFSITKPVNTESKPPPRIATIEVKEAVKPAEPPVPLPVPPPVTPPKEAQPQPPPQEIKKPTPPKVSTDPGAPKKQAQAAAPKFDKPLVKEKPKTGLNSPAKVTDVNSVGLFKAMKNTAQKKGPGVSADKIINEGIVSETVSGDDNAKVVLQQPPAGVLGRSNGGGPKKGPGLNAATTTLSGSGKYDPKSIGPIAGSGGTGMGNGAGLAKTDDRSGSGKSLGSMDVSGFSVSGGLDKETVLRVIRGYRNQMRTCYERALVGNPRLAGKVTCQWTISAVGAVSSAAVVSSEAHSPLLEACVLEVIKKMVFPPAQNQQSTIVRYPWAFTGKN